MVNLKTSVSPTTTASLAAKSAKLFGTNMVFMRHDEDQSSWNLDLI
jgi:hypothetical protein